MLSPISEKTINETLQYGNALLKFISPNDAGATGSHQSGILLPKGRKGNEVWDMFTPHAPVRGENEKHTVLVEWPQISRTTESVVTWYGRVKQEYRLTNFGKGFILIPDTVGDLLVLIAKSQSEFIAYILDKEEDIEEVIATLGVQPFEHWAIYKNGAAQVEDTDACLEKQFQEFAKTLETFPRTNIFSNSTRDMLAHCFSELAKQPADTKLLEYYSTEYRLFQVVERQIYQSEIGRLFKDVDDFLHTAASIMNRRKSRAGHSLENHVDSVLLDASVPHEMQPRVDGRPDIVFPSKEAYLDPSYPTEKLIVMGVKTTCKDRWRQVLNEGKRVKDKHILTLQPSISSNQLTEMHEAGVTLVVPRKLQDGYPKNHPLTILSVEDFIEKAKKVVV